MGALVSIVVPVYNSQRFLCKCVDSLTSQTYENLEIVLFDDGSKDDSLKICRFYEKKDKRVKVFSRENKGVARTRLDAFNLSCGEYIAFVDSDDYVDKNFVFHMVEHIERENVDAVSCQYCNVNKEKISRSRYRLYGRFDKEGIENILRTSFLYDKQIKMAGVSHYLCTKLIRRKFVERVLSEGIGQWYCEDLVGITRLLFDIDSLYISKDYGYYYVIHEAQATQKYDSSLWDMYCKAYEKILDADKNNLLTESLKIRMILHIKHTLSAKMIANKKIGFKKFREDVSKLRDKQVLEMLFSCKTMDADKPAVLTFQLMKHRAWFLLYCFLKLSFYIRKN